MAYVRVRGRQLVIAQGVRDSQSRKVHQHILFTLYSRSEARASLGRGHAGGAERFRGLLTEQYPEIKFDWKAIRQGIEANYEVLPEHHDPSEEEFRARFRGTLESFARELILADPYVAPVRAKATEALRGQLEYLRHLIDRRLKLPSISQSFQKDSFEWTSRLRTREVPPDIEEAAARLYDRKEFAPAEDAHRLLVECFPNFADGYNILGLIALERSQLDEAIRWFEKTASVGRKLFPKRFGRSRYWVNLETRPYMRALRNLTAALNQAGRYDEALSQCDRMERECGDTVSAVVYRAVIAMNRGKWTQAASEAAILAKVNPSHAFVAAFALYEAGRPADALPYFLHALLNHPQAARDLCEGKRPAPRSRDEALDLEISSETRKSLHAYFTLEFRKSSHFFKKILSDSRVRAMIKDLETLRRHWTQKNPADSRSSLRRLNEMRSSEFALAKALQLQELLDGKS